VVTSATSNAAVSFLLCGLGIDSVATVAIMRRASELLS